MTDVRIEHSFDCSEKTFWDRIFFDDDFNRAMYLQHLQFQQWQVVERHETDSTITRVVSVTPKIGELPGAIKSIIGDGLVYREEGSFDKQTRRYRVNVVPSVMADKLTVRGETWVKELSSCRCSRIFEAKVNVKIFGVGGIIEKRIIADLQLSYNAGAVFTAEYLDKQGIRGT